MSLTVGNAVLTNITAQPFGYEETDTANGLTAKRWTLQGLATPDEWLDLLGVYNTWRNSKITEPDTAKSKVIGTTVAFSGSGAGENWTNVACWFTEAPSGEQAGAYISVSAALVDANQALAVILKQEENSEEASEDLPDLGTYTINGVVLTLLKPTEAYVAGPQLTKTVNGYHYVSGPMVVEKLIDIEGYFNVSQYPSGWANIRSWYESQILLIPTTNATFPITPPTASVEKKVVNGVSTTRYTVSITLGVVR